MRQNKIPEGVSRKGLVARSKGYKQKAKHAPVADNSAFGGQT